MGRTRRTSPGGDGLSGRVRALGCGRMWVFLRLLCDSARSSRSHGFDLGGMMGRFMPYVAADCE